MDRPSHASTARATPSELSDRDSGSLPREPEHRRSSPTPPGWKRLARARQNLML